MDFIRINTADNVAVAIHDVEAGASFDIDGVIYVLRTLFRQAIKWPSRISQKELMW